MIMMVRYAIIGAMLAAMNPDLYPVDAQQLPKFVGDIEPVITTTGGQTMLNCTVSGLSFQLGQMVIWTFMDNTTDGKIISQNTYMFLRRMNCNKYLRKYEVIKREFNDTTTYSLVIRCLDQNDSGIYRCSMYLPGVETSSLPAQNASLYVKADIQEMPKIVGIKPVIKPPGGEAVLNCTVTGINLDLRQSVVWAYMNPTTDNKVISADVMMLSRHKRCQRDVTKYKVISSSFQDSITYSLVIRCLNESDSGIYQCTIFQPGFSKSLMPAQNGTLIVEEPDCYWKNCRETAKSASNEMRTTYLALFTILIFIIVLSH